MRVCYVAFDPGGTTGWAAVTFEEMFNPITEEVEVLDVKWRKGHIGPKEHHLTLYNFLGTLQVEKFHVITESFEYRNQSRAGLVLVSLEYIGVMKLFCAERKVPFSKQTASMGKGFAKDTNIKRLGLWSPGFKHAMDAMRHLIYFIVNDSTVAPALRAWVLENGFKPPHLKLL